MNSAFTPSPPSVAFIAMKHLFKQGLRRLVESPPRLKKGDRNATVLAVSALKGGVGKTTTAVNLAAALARFHHMRVLLVDLDPQNHVTTALRRVTEPGVGTISQVLLRDGEPDLIEIAVDTQIPDLLVTPRDNALDETEALLTTKIGKETLLRDKLELARTHFDAILLDCPPNPGNLTLNALVAADTVLVPCEPSPLAIEGVNQLVNTVSTVVSRLNPDLTIMGVLLTRMDRRNPSLNASVVESLTDLYGDAVLPANIGINTSLAKAQVEGTDIYGYDPKSRGAQDYRKLAQLVIELIEADMGSPRH